MFATSPNVSPSESRDIIVPRPGQSAAPRAMAACTRGQEVSLQKLQMGARQDLRKIEGLSRDAIPCVRLARVR